MTSARKLVIVAVLLSGGCGDWRDDHDFTWQGERVTVYGYGYTEADVCGGSFAELDGHIAMIESDLGIEDGPGYTYRWLSWARLDGDAPCGSHVACAIDGEAMSPWLPHIHEAVHSVIDEGRCPRLLDEGLAMYYEHGTVDGEPPTWQETSLAGLLEHGIGDDAEGPRVGAALRFTAFLAETQGPASVLDLCRELGAGDPSAAAWGDAILNVYGITLEQLIAEYEAHPKCTYSQMRAKLWGCQRPADVLLTGEGERFVIESGCDDPNATNGIGTPGDAVLRRTVQVPREMLVEVSAYGWNRVGPRPEYLITECGSCSDDPGIFTDDGHPFVTSRHRLRPGRYEVAVFFDRRDRVALDLRVIDAAL